MSLEQQLLRLASDLLAAGEGKVPGRLLLHKPVPPLTAVESLSHLLALNLVNLEADHP